MKLDEFGEEEKIVISLYSNEFYSIIFEYALLSDVKYVAEKLEIPISEVERIVSLKESITPLEKAKQEIKVNGDDPFKLRLSRLRFLVLDDLEKTALGNGDPKIKLDAQKTILEMSDDYNTKSVRKENNENKINAPTVVFEIRKEKK